MFWNKKIFTADERIAVDVVDLEAARRWYSEKLGLGYSSTELAEEEGDMVLGYSAEQPLVYLVEVEAGERADARPNHPPILFAPKVDAAHRYLSSRGVSTNPVESDRGGNRFFRFRDLEGNEVEVCQQT